MAAYENYGDKNFFEGGLFIRNNGDGDFDYIKCDEVCDQEDTYLFSVGSIDPTDSWIKLEEVKKSCELHNDSKEELVRAILDYYGPANCNSTDELLTSKEVQERMDAYAVEEENVFEENTWSRGPLY